VVEDGFLSKNIEIFSRSSECCLSHMLELCSILYLGARARIRALLYFHDRKATASRVNNTEEVTMTIAENCPVLLHFKAEFFHK
jgi:hypothetical protein